MDENRITGGENRQKPNTGSTVLRDIAAGFLIGVAFIIPGFSGGSIAAIIGIYERLINAITELFTSFKKSICTLLPIGIGLVLGAVSLLYPLKLALEFAPLPTVSLFVGLALGGTFSISDRIKGKVRPTNVIALLLPFLLALSLCFIPTGADVDLLSLNAGGYLLLFLVGVLGSAALVIPGISGSMILLILGYYNPIIRLITDELLTGRNVGIAIAVLAVTALGIAVGFIIISFIMRALLSKCPRGTYFAIVGFILGSIPSAFISTSKDAGFTLSTLPGSPWHWGACVLLLLLGFAAALAFIIKVKKMQAGKED